MRPTFPNPKMSGVKMSNDLTDRMTNTIGRELYRHLKSPYSVLEATLIALVRAGFTREEIAAVLNNLGSHPAGREGA